MLRYRDWRAAGEYDWAAADELMRAGRPARGVMHTTTRKDFATVDKQVRDLAETAGAITFRDVWPGLVADREADADTGHDQWRVRALAELSWFGLRGGDEGFHVWDAKQLGRHVERLRALGLRVREHEVRGLDLVWEAMYWTDAALRGWERVMAATGKEEAPDALLAALLDLVHSRGWPRVDAHPGLFGFLYLTGPDGEEVAIDLGYHDEEGRDGCSWVYDPAPDRTDDLTPTVVEWSHPGLLDAFTAFLRDVGLDPAPPAWPATSSAAGL